MMDADAALEFVDQLVYTKTGKHLNDLERKVFIGSWEGRTYREIYPFKPEHIEKNVGFKLWNFFSKASYEDFGKRDIRGPLERAINRKKQIAIIYREQNPDAQIAKTLGQSVQRAGDPFLANLDTVSNVGDSWVSQLEAKLTCCDYGEIPSHHYGPSVETEHMFLPLTRELREPYSALRANDQYCHGTIAPQTPHPSIDKPDDSFDDTVHSTDSRWHSNALYMRKGTPLTVTSLGSSLQRPNNSADGDGIQSPTVQSGATLSLDADVDSDHLHSTPLHSPCTLLASRHNCAHTLHSA